MFLYIVLSLVFPKKVHLASILSDVKIHFSQSFTFLSVYYQVLKLLSSHDISKEFRLPFPYDFHLVFHCSANLWELIYLLCGHPGYVLHRSLEPHICCFMAQFHHFVYCYGLTSMK